VVVISQRPSSIFGAEKESFAENKNSIATIIHIPLFIVCSFLPDSEL